jgi:hypothetical protein
MGLNDVHAMSGIDGLHNPFRVGPRCNMSAQGWPPRVGQPWAALHNAFSVEDPILSVIASLSRLFSMSLNCARLLRHGRIPKAACASAPGKPLKSNCWE